MLSSTTLVERILPNYPLDAPLRCHVLQHGDNDTYLVQNKHTKWILRVWTTSRRLRMELEAEMELLDALYQSKVPVAQPIKRTDGSYLQAVQAPEGPRFVGLFTFAPGQPPGQQITAEQAYAYGNAVATMHTIADTLQQRYVRPQLDMEGLLDEPLRVIAPFLNHRPGDRVYLEALAEQLKPYVRELPLTLPDYGLCHGDLHKTNVLWDRDGHLTLIDFDSCGYSWRAYDLAVLFWSTRYLPQAGAVRNAYLKGYTDVRSLSRSALEAIPYFVAVRDLYIMGVEIGHAQRGVDASAAPDDAFFDEHIHVLQEWMPAISDGRFITI